MGATRVEIKELLNMLKTMFEDDEWWW